MKKVLALVLVAVMAIGMGVPAFAATADLYEITGLAGSNTIEVPGFTSTAGYGDSFIYDEVVPADEEVAYINFSYDDFVYANRAGTAELHDGTDDSDPVAKNLFSRGKVQIRTRYSKGKEAIAGITLQPADSRIKIEFVDEYVATKDLDFEFTVYLTIDGKGDSDYGFTFTGTLANTQKDYDKDTDYIYLADQIIAKADDSIRGVELELGDSVFMRDMRLTSGKKYYGTATTETTDAQEDRIAEYGFNACYTLKTIGLSTTGNYVYIDDLDRNDYVYGVDADGDLYFAGMGNEALPYAAEYYVSANELDIAGSDAGDVEPTEDDDWGEEGPELSEDLGGDDVATDNANFNPGTGA